MAAERAIPILVQVCGALQEAHDKGIVHRDLKPENIFLCKQGGLTDFPKVLDFGLAKVTERQMRPGSLILTQEGMVFGTPEFMSPEQAQGRTLDARSDIYSLAVILYEGLTGKLPFSARTPMEYIQKHVMEPPILLNSRVPERNSTGLEQVHRQSARQEAGRTGSVGSGVRARAEAVRRHRSIAYRSRAAARELPCADSRFRPSQEQRCRAATEPRLLIGGRVLPDRRHLLAFVFMRVLGHDPLAPVA